MTNFKRKIIHFLGGFVYDDFTPPEQAVILEMQACHARDRAAMNRLLQDSCRPIYTPKD